MIRGSANETPYSLKLLSEDAMDRIAEDVRKRPIAEVGRHVMPLLHHILTLDSRSCDTCRFWVGYDQAHANHGECTNPAVKVHQRPIGERGQQFGDLNTLITPFDWQCKGWEEKAAGDGLDAQCQAG